MKIVSDYIIIKDDVGFYLDFEVDKNNQINAILTVSSENFDIEIFSVPVCESFIYKYTKEYVIKNDQLLNALLKGEPYDYLADILKKNFDRIDDFSIIIYKVESYDDNDSVSFKILFQSKKNNISIKINDIDESDDEYSFEYDSIKKACVGIDHKKIKQANYENKFDRW
ncbi:MAG: hypothetical protein WC799_15260 [Desulfobacteraceae bacterium]